MSDTRKNLLGEEVSPYLLQHRDNPVWWQPWGDEAFALAKQLNLPVFLSIGYSTCYWCHMMEKESFEDEQVAAHLNESFVAIKLDREERPDIDQIYMDAVVGLTGHGGWPMSVFLTPEQQPFWAGTYIPKPQFIHLLKEVGEKWIKDKDRIVTSAAEITSALRQREIAGEGVIPSAREAMKGVQAESLSRFDKKDGGFGSAPKFPPAQLVRLLLRSISREPNAQVKEAISVTLEKMACGGIFDHLGGGFSRYSTDAEWRVPHFEKMLYDNALLTSAYLEAGASLNREDFHDVAVETLHYLKRDMKDPKTGAYFAAEDAGEVGKEGEFYVFEFEEIKNLVSPSEFDLLRARFEVEPGGNFEGKIVFHLKSNELWSERFPAGVREKLLSARNKRERPHRDEKLLTAWNALLLSTFVDAIRIGGLTEYEDEAKSVASFLVEKAFQDTLCTSIASKSSGGEYERRGEGGCLDDYAYTVKGLIDLFEVTGETHWLTSARDIHEVQEKLLWSVERKAYRFSSDSSLLTEKFPFFDGPIPSGNAISISNLVRLSAYFLSTDLRDRASSLLKSYSTVIQKVPSAAASAIMGLSHFESGKELITAGFKEERAQLFQELKGFHFDLSVSAVLSEQEDYGAIPLLSDKKHEQPHYYLCEFGKCFAPVHDRNELFNKLTTLHEENA